MFKLPFQATWNGSFFMFCLSTIPHSLAWELMQMRCPWNELLSVLPTWMRREVDELSRETLQELRLRRGQPPELICKNGEILLKRKIAQEDLAFVVNTASRYSPWAATTAGQGYITAPGGHRIGLCGESVIQQGSMTGLRQISSLCVRVARDCTGIAEKLACYRGSILIIGRPGSGKTTLLRDLIRVRGKHEQVGVVDERCELFPSAFTPEGRVDVLSGCGKTQGVELLLRTMRPETIAVDEITSKADCDGLIHCGWCGVSLLATAHAASKSDFFSRPVYKPLTASGLFSHLVILRADKTWTMERVDV